MTRSLEHHDVDDHIGPPQAAANLGEALFRPRKGAAGMAAGDSVSL